MTSNTTAYRAAYYQGHKQEAISHQHAYYNGHREHERARAAEYRTAHAEEIKDRRQGLKLAAIDAYGGRACACCGETHIDFLCIDHIDGGGGEHRKLVGGGSTFFRWLKTHNYPPGYRVLCFNCNNAFAMFGMCPHNEVME